MWCKWAYPKINDKIRKLCFKRNYHCLLKISVILINRSGVLCLLMIIMVIHAGMFKIFTLSNKVTFRYYWNYQTTKQSANR
jgi:hypothetical protein